MLDLSPDHLRKEIDASFAVSEPIRRLMRESVMRYAGSAYSRAVGGTEGDQDIENHTYEYISLILPKIISDNPAVEVRSRRGGPYRELAEMMRHAANRWVKDVDLRKTLLTVAVDMLFGYGVVVTTLEACPGVNPRDGFAPMRPACHRLPPGRFFFDSLATSLENARFAGHMVVRDLDDLLADESYNREVVESLTPDVDLDKLKDERGGRDPVSRKEILLYEVWVPEHQTDDSLGPEMGFNGTIHTLAVCPSGENQEAKASYVRAPRPFYGPRWGPYTMFGVYPVPGSPYRLSPLIAINQQIKDVNKAAKAVSDASTHYKRLVICSADNPDLRKKLEGTPTNFVVPVKGFTKDQVQTIEIGGVTEQQLQHVATSLERLSRVSGIFDAQRGNVTGNATATENAIADSSSQSRTSTIQQTFAAGVQEIVETATWFMFVDDRVSFPLGPEAGTEMGQEDPWFVGGLDQDQTPADWENLEFQIEAYSMERTSEVLLQRRFNEVFENIMKAVPLVQQAPFINWAKLLEMGGDVLNADMSDIVDEQMLNQLRMAASGGMGLQQPGIGGPMAGQPGGPQNPLAEPSNNVFGGLGPQLPGLLAAGSAA